MALAMLLIRYGTMLCKDARLELSTTYLRTSTVVPYCTVPLLWQPAAGDLPSTRYHRLAASTAAARENVAEGGPQSLLSSLRASEVCGTSGTGLSIRLRRVGDRQCHEA